MMKKALYTAIVSMAFVVGMGFSNKLVFADEQVTTPQVTTVAETTTEAETTEPTTTQPVTEEPTTTNNHTTGNQKKNYWVKTKKGTRYYFNSKSYAKNRLVKVGKAQYGFDKNGYKVKGIKKIGKKTYYFTKSGKLSTKTGIIKYKKNKYYVKAGVLKKGLVKVKSYYYYFGKKTYKMVKNKTKKVASKYYVFDKKGKAIPRSLARYQAYITLKKITNSKDSKMTKIRKAYSYVVRSSSYRIKPGFVQPSAANWVESYGYNMLVTHSGRCYSYAAEFALMAKEIGFNVTVVRGVIGSAPHAWTEVKIGGGSYIFDPNMGFERYRKGRSMWHFYDTSYARMPGVYSVYNRYPVL